MELDLVQAIEILANIGVLAGIVFLAFEIRQNTESVRATTAKCTRSDNRRIDRYPDEDVLDAVQAELAKDPGAVRERKKLAEHPYGTIKHWMGSTHFLMKRLPNMKAEMSLHVVAYNLKRAIRVLGVPGILDHLQAA
jgi:hypothetical protein